MFDKRISREYNQKDINNWFTRIANSKEHEVFLAWLDNEREILIQRNGSKEAVLNHNIRADIGSQLFVIDRLYKQILSFENKALK